MKTYVHCALVGFIVVTPLLFAQTNASAAGPREQLQQLTALLQQSPNDQALRERIIALALTLSPMPATPDAVTMAEGAAEYAFKNAKTNSDYSDAAKQYEKALLLAPWLAADYFNCGVAYEKAGEYKEAIRSFELYLLAAPNANDSQAIKKRVGGLQYAAQKAQDEASSPEAKLERFYKRLDGGVWEVAHRLSVYVDGSQAVDDDIGHEYIAVSGQTISYSLYFRPVNGDVTQHWKHVDYEPNTPPDWTATLTSHKFSHNSSHTRSEFTISDDGQSITEEDTTVYPRGTSHQTSTFARIK